MKYNIIMERLLTLAAMFLCYMVTTFAQFSGLMDVSSFSELIRRQA